MLVLCVDSSTPAVTAALADVSDGPDRPLAALSAGPDGALTMIARRRTVDARAHGELLAPHVAAVLAEAGASPRDLGAIVAGLGPGPFTGLRVGLVTAVSMGQTLGIPTYGVCSLDAIGHAAARVVDHGPVLVATDARRREVYWAVYQAGRRGSGVPVTGPAVGAPAEAAATAAGLGVVAAVGEGALRYRDALGVPVLDEPCYPPPEALLALAVERVAAGAAGERLTPLYLRRPDAVAPGARKAVLQR